MRDISYNGAHMRVRRRRGRAQEHACVACGERAQQWGYSHDCPVAGTEIRKSAFGGMGPVSYCRCDNSDHYDPLCFDCHRFFDRLLREAKS